MNSRESIYAALFTVASTAAGFVTAERKVRHWTDVGPGEMPALFLEQGKQKAEKVPPKPTKWTLTADLIIYVADSTSGEDDIATALNNLVDAVDAALAPSPATNTQTLGGLVTDCRIQGDVEIYEGNADNRRLGIAVIPVEIIATV